MHYATKVLIMTMCFLLTGLLGPAPNIPMSPLMDMHLQLGLLSLVVLDLKQKDEFKGEVRTLFACYSKTCLKPPLKNRQTKVLTEVVV